MDSASHVREPVVEELRGGQEAGAAEVLRVFEHEEKVEVSDEDADEFHDTTAGNDHVEGEEDPRQIHCFELESLNGNKSIFEFSDLRKYCFQTNSVFFTESSFQQRNNTVSFEINTIFQFHCVTISTKTRI